MKRLYEVLEVVFTKLHKSGWDNTLIVSGDEGTGKTNLVLNVMDYWDNKKYGEVKPEAIKRLGMDKLAFARALKLAKKGDVVNYDESGELSNKRQLNKFNFLITTSYQVIRNENLFTILTIPDLFELNPFFTKRRARGLIVVYKRGSFAYWDKKRLRKIVDYNANRVRKSAWRVKPLFYDNFPTYNGILKEPYEALKDRHTAKIREEIYNKLKEEMPKDKTTEILIRAKAALGTQKTAEIFGIDKTTVNRKIREAKAVEEEYNNIAFSEE